ncbi:MAG TPA: FMN-binding protein [Trebonia sp.]|nr:FMN-binding protein [Trebonia sp.]
MRRAVLTLGGTLAGIAALLALKFQPATSLAAGTSAAPGTTGTASAAPATSGSAKASASGSGGKTATTTGRTFTGAVDNTSYGPMQVAITVSGGKITKITVVQQTNTGSQSQQIDANALPKLTSEALTAQSASIDAVSGASYTSAGYIKSLQSAIDQEKM